MTGDKKTDPRYAVVFGACLTQFMIIGLLFAYGLFFKPLEAEFGWSRTVLSACASLAFFVMGMLAIGVGNLSDRFGPRPVLGVTGVLYGIGFALISQVSEPWHLFAIFGLFIGLGMSTHDVVTLSTVARWFERRRGVMTGVVKTGTAFGQIAVPPFAALIIASYGWRSAALTLGALAFVLLLVAASVMTAPAKVSAAGEAKANAETGIAFRTVIGTRVFWTLGMIQFLFLPALTTIPLHVAVHGMDLGMSAALAAALLSVVGAASIVGRMTIGALSDRIGGKRGLILCFLPLLASLLALLATSSPSPLFAVVALYGFGHGGLFTIMAPTIAEFFGTRAHGTVFGAIVFFGTIGGALGPILAGWIFDTTGSYDPAFMTLAGMAALGLVLVLSLPRTDQGRVAGSKAVPSESGG